jgi:hypothetical protein
MNLQRSVRLDKIVSGRRLKSKGTENMKNRSTYALLVQSEEKSRNIMETALYALFALSAVVSIWQFAQQPSSLPLERVGTVNEQRIAS